MPKRLAKCFDDVLDKDGSYSILDGGIRVIELKRVTGTVDKCGELDTRFMYYKRRDRGELSRWGRLEEVLRRNVLTPPIEVYLYRGEYYVIDGNRRVGTHLALGMEYIDAHVLEYVEKNDFEARNGAFYRRRFETETGIRGIDLVYESGYRVLLEEISRHGGGGGAAAWYSGEYLPACRIIERTNLPSAYEELNPGDIYVLVADFFRKYAGSRPEHGFDSVLSTFLFAHHAQKSRRTYFSRFCFGLLRLFAGGEIKIFHKRGKKAK